MVKHVHIHLHDDDEEQKRDEKGQFASSAEIASKIGAPSYATIHEGGGEHGGGGFNYMKKATHAEAHKELSGAGFVRASPAKSSTTSHKMGRSAAHYSVSKKRSNYTHPHGHTASIETTAPPKYGDEKRPSTYYNVSRKP